MDVYILDAGLEQVALIDVFYSFVWTERYQDCGEFEIEMPIPDDTILRYIKEDNFVSIKESDQVMVIETYQVVTDFENGDRLTFSGRSAASILDRRIIWSPITLSGNVEKQVYNIVSTNLIAPSIKAREYSRMVFIFSGDNRISSSEILRTDYFGEDLLEVVIDLCFATGVGFKVELDPEFKRLNFELYMGQDRSYDQDKNAPVVFSDSFENITGSSFVFSKKEYKNVCLVAGNVNEHFDQKFAVAEQEKDKDSTGINRRETFVDGSDVEAFTSYQVHHEERDTEKVYSLSRYGNLWPSEKLEKIYNELSDQDKEHAELRTSDEDNSSMPDWLQAVTVTGSFSWYHISAYTETIYQEAPEQIASMTTKGLEELGEHAIESAFEGEIEAVRQFVYGRDFFLGDIVHVVNRYGLEDKVCVTEVCITEDSNGRNVTPTFTSIY